MTTKPRPARVLSVTARNKTTGHVETCRYSNEHMSPQTAAARMGAWLVLCLEWRPTDILITNVKFSTETLATQQLRNRMRHT